jgi:hypothetical protein
MGCLSERSQDIEAKSSTHLLPGHALWVGSWCVPIPIVGTPVMDIVVWLRSRGLGKYEAVFRENEIDETVLPSLTAEDLKELGVTALGHRRKLLDAIAALRTDTSAQGPSSDLKTAPRPEGALPPLPAGRVGQ